MHTMIRNLLFLKTLDVFLERLQELLKEQQDDFQDQLLEILYGLTEVRDDLEVSQAVDDVLALARDSPTAELVQALYQQAGEKAGQLGQTSTAVLMNDPTTNQFRYVEIRLKSEAVAKGRAASVSYRDVIAVAQALIDTLNDDLDFAIPANGGDVKSFDAYPALNAPEQVVPAEEFEVTVGFRDDLDPELLEAQPIHIENPPVGAEFLVILLADGAEVTDGHHRRLPLAKDATVKFTCRANPDTNQITLSVDYFYNNQVAGMAKRHLLVAKAGADVPTPATKKKLDPCRMSLPSAESQVDLTVTLAKTNEGQLQWTFAAPQPPILSGPITTSLADAREFSADLLGELKMQKHTGPWAAQILDNKGQDIADIMPPEFFDILGQVYAAIQRVPTLLLLTEETYVPWELALLEEPLNPDLPPFLAAQTYMGRWLRHEKVVSPPPTRISLERFTVVASEYDKLKSGQPSLPEAIAERKNLKTYFSQFAQTTQALEATQEDLGKVIFGEKSPGHLIHFAVHGMSDPEANDQFLLLADKKRLSPSALIGSYRCGKTPTFSFMFLNACQVGAAGSSLGQAAGFPGDIIRGGALGFIAPLWEVHDVPARTMAEALYRASLEGGQSMAEFLQNQRANYNREESTTPMAYIYYGHPALHLRLKSEEIKND